MQVTDLKIWLQVGHIDDPRDTEIKLQTAKVCIMTVTCIQVNWSQRVKLQ